MGLTLALVNTPQFGYPYHNNDPIPVNQVDRIEFCSTNNAHVAQAVCQYYGAGNVRYTQYYGSTVKRTSDPNSAVNVILAELVCPKLTKNIKDCGINLLPGKEQCKAVRVQCYKKTGCYKPNNYVWSKKYNRLDGCL